MSRDVLIIEIECLRIELNGLTVDMIDYSEMLEGSRVLDELIVENQKAVA